MNDEELISLREKLNLVTEQLNNKIIEFEAYLANLGFGIRVWSGEQDKIKIGYGKFDNKWHVLIKYITDDGNEIINILTKAPRNLRLHGYKRRDELVIAILESAKSLTDKIEKVITKE
jgi:hypothetical protein